MLDLQEISDAIEAEGSLEYYFMDYTSETFVGTPLEQPVAKFREAVREILAILPAVE